nr:unnamed protein product [Spirometra erinaceieuropaei]
MADLLAFLPHCTVCAGVATAVVLVLSFILCRCLAGKPGISLTQKSKLKKGKEKKKSPEGVQAAGKPPPSPKSQTIQSSTEPKVQPAVVPQTQSAPLAVSPHKNRKSNTKVEQAARASEVDVAAVEDDEWVTVKRGKSSHGPQTVDTSAKTNQKPKQGKGSSKESTPKEAKNSQKSKKSAESKPQRSSDEESPVVDVPVLPKPAASEPVEEVWQDIPSAKRKKQRARKE